MSDDKLTYKKVEANVLAALREEYGEVHVHVEPEDTPVQYCVALDVPEEFIDADEGNDHRIIAWHTTDLAYLPAPGAAWFTPRKLFVLDDPQLVARIAWHEALRRWRTTTVHRYYGPSRGYMEHLIRGPFRVSRKTYARYDHTRKRSET